MTVEHDEMKARNMCGSESADLPASGRCNECQSLKTRLYRHFQKSGGDERRQWETLSKEQRQVFYSQWHGQVGIDLKAAISETMVEAVRDTKKETSVKAVTWLDEFQLKKKYEGREEQLEKIKKNADTMECPTREVTMWADPDYTSSEMTRMDSERIRKRELRADEISRPHKKPKTDPALKLEPGKLTDKQLAMLGTEKLRLSELLLRLQLTNYKAALPELVDFVTKRDRDQLKLCEMKLKSTIQTIDMFTESGSGNFRDLKKEISGSRMEATTYHTRLKQTIADAEKEVTAESAAVIKEQMEAFEDTVVQPAA